MGGSLDGEKDTDGGERMGEAAKEDGMIGHGKWRGWNSTLMRG